MSRVIKIVLIASLLFNVLFTGAAIGYFSHFFLKRNHPGKTQHPHLLPELPPEKQRIFLETMKKTHLLNRDIHKKLKKARQRAIEIVADENFNENDYLIVVKQIHNYRLEMMERLANATIELADKFNSRERAILAEMLRHPPPPLEERKDKPMKKPIPFHDKWREPDVGGSKGAPPIEPPPL